MAQFGRPDGNITNTGNNDFAAIDEASPSDADFWFGDNNVAEELEVSLSNVNDPSSSTGHIFRYRVAKTNAGTVNGTGNAVTVTARLMQGTTQIATDSAKTADGTWTQYAYTLTSGEADAITDYTDLRLEFVTSASGGSPANRRGGAVSWAELEVPDAIVVNTFRAFAQAQARIKQTYQGYAQAQANIKATSRGYAQAQALIYIPSVYGDEVRADSPSAWYRMGEASGDVIDWMGGPSGTTSGTVTRDVAGAINPDDGAINYNGSTGFVNVPDHNGVDLGDGPFSIELWLKRDRSGAITEEPITKGSNAPTISIVNDKVGMYGFGLGLSVEETGTSVDTIAYHHYVVTHDGTTSIIYKDGEDVSGTSTNRAFASNTTDLNIGRNTGNSNYFDGSIDEVAFYKSVLSPARVLAHFQASGQATAIRGYGQAQAQIKQTYFGLGQAQASILQTYYGLGQSQADIKQTYYGLGQAQGTILQTYYGLGQAQASILTTYNSFGQAQADIKQTYYGLANAQGTILTNYQGFGQANAAIAQTAFGLGQSQASIKTTYNQHGQAQADIKQTYQGFGQAQGYIKVTDIEGFGQAQALITATYQGYGQAQACIQGTAFAQAQASIKQTYYGLAQAEAWIETTYVAHAQSQASIKQVYYGLGQAEAWIENTYQGYGQAQAQIKGIDVCAFGQAQAEIASEIVTTYAHAQAQAQIKAFDVNAYAQSQANIKQSYQGYGQSQADIKQTYQGYGQCQALIATYQQGYGQAQGTILATSNAFGQSQGNIKQTYVAYANAQGLISTAVINCAQAQASILATSQAYAQAQAMITSGNLGFAQAQALIIVVGITQFGQANALIIKSAGYGQAQALIVSVFIIQSMSLFRDRPSINLALTDTDSGSPSLDLSDRSITLILSDKNY